MDTEVVITRVKEQLCDVCKVAKTAAVAWETRDWTREIKRALCKLGQDEGYAAWANGLDDKLNEEWLYDVVWIENVEEKDWYSAIRSMPLAAESEWGKRRAVEADFDKLVVSRARIRVLVFDLGLVGSDAFESLAQRAAQFEPDGLEARTLLAGWAFETGRFEYAEF